jgi:hypothetical protein
MSQSSINGNAYRCIVAPERSAAVLRVGRTRFPVNVLDTSRDGFTVRVPNAAVAKMDRKRNSPRLELRFDGERWEVDRSGSYADNHEFTQLSLVRIRDLTKLKQPGGFEWASVTQLSAQKDPTLLVGLLVAFLIACFCLPGIGDQIGTAPKVSRAVRGMWNSFDKSVFP